jgi:tellurite resistance protein TerA
VPIDYTKEPKPERQQPGSGQQGQPAVSLSKVTLTKAAPSVSLTKAGSAGGRAAGQPALDL